MRTNPRRRFLAGAAAALASAALPVGAQTNPTGLDFPIEDYHGPAPPGRKPIQIRKLKA